MKVPCLKIISLLEAVVFQKGFKKGFHRKKNYGKIKVLLHLMPAVKPHSPESCWQQAGREALKTAFEALVSELTSAALPKSFGAVTLPCLAPALCSDARPRFKAVLVSSGGV